MRISCCRELAYELAQHQSGGQEEEGKNAPQVGRGARRPARLSDAVVHPTPTVELALPAPQPIHAWVASALPFPTPHRLLTVREVAPHPRMVIGRVLAQGTFQAGATRPRSLRVAWSALSAAGRKRRMTNVARGARPGLNVVVIGAGYGGDTRGNSSCRRVGRRAPRTCYASMCFGTSRGAQPVLLASHTRFLRFRSAELRTSAASRHQVRSASRVVTRRILTSLESCPHMHYP